MPDKAIRNTLKAVDFFCSGGGMSSGIQNAGIQILAGIDYDNSCKETYEANIVGAKFIHADVKQYLKTIPADYFDIIIMDPPTFSNSKRMDDILDIQRDHVELINDCIKGLKKGGALYFSTNFRKFELDTAAINSAAIKDITKATTPFDFEGKLFRWCFYIVK